MPKPGLWSWSLSFLFVINRRLLGGRGGLLSKNLRILYFCLRDALSAGGLGMVADGRSEGPSSLPHKPSSFWNSNEPFKIQTRPNSDKKGRIKSPKVRNVTKIMIDLVRVTE